MLVVLFLAWLTGLKNLVLSWSGTAEEARSPGPPNVLLIVADDLGYDDNSVINSSGLPTPNLEHLARQGVTFRRHYADSTCTPSRVAMLSGRYPERSGFRPTGIEIPAEFPTLAEQLKSAGYSTYLTGKWHAGEERRQAWPENKGFDNWFGFLTQFELSGDDAETGEGSRKRPTYHNPMLRRDGGERIRHPGHLTDILTDHTIQKLKELQAGGKPWFLYHAFLAPHTPIQPASRYQERFPATPEGKYTALVTQLDDAIGRILDAVEQDNTLVVFVSDNGGPNTHRDNNFPFYGAKNKPLEGAYRTPLIVSWPGKIPSGKFVDEVVMNVDVYPTVLAATQTIAPDHLDGTSLLNLMIDGVPIAKRSRSWEGYHPNINSLSHSYLSASGEWRLSSRQGVLPHLFHLSEDPTGKTDVADQHGDITGKLTSEYWQDHWDKSRIAVTAHRGDREDRTLYTGFDAMRTPYRHGFSIGIEIGPLSQGSFAGDGSKGYVVAGQEGSWDLRYMPRQGLEWHIGDAVLRDASFDPSRCNAIVLTGYFQPLAYLATRRPVSVVKLYSSGFLRDFRHDFQPQDVDDAVLRAPTLVNYSGRAIFSNMVLSSFSDAYSPRSDSPLLPGIEALYRQKKLAIADVQMMNSQLCKKSSVRSDITF